MKTDQDHAGYMAECRTCGEQKPLLEFVDNGAPINTAIGATTGQCLACASARATETADRLRLAHQAMARLHPDIYQASTEAVDECLLPPYLLDRVGEQA